MSTQHTSTHYLASHYRSSHAGGAVIALGVFPQGADPHWRALRARILREDDEILAIVMAFMEIKD